MPDRCESAFLERRVLRTDLGEHKKVGGTARLVRGTWQRETPYFFMLSSCRGLFVFSAKSDGRKLKLACGWLAKCLNR